MCRNIAELSPSYWYEGICPRSRKLLRLPRTKFIEAIAHELMQDLATDEQFSREGKMYGVLLTETAQGDQQILKAFSGLLDGRSVLDGWVPPIPGRDLIYLNESITLTLLESLKKQIIQLYEIPERYQYQKLSEEYKKQLKQLSEKHHQRKLERQQQRQANYCNSELDEQSKRDGIEKRNLKRDRATLLNPLKQIVDRADGRIQQLKQQRKQLSQQLQSQMYDSYRITNFAGETRSLSELLASMPTGTGECCAPKLLHYTATHGLKPLAMAEFWWGESVGDKMQGEFYGACVDRCQPIMGFLLSGLESIEIVYQDDWLIVVNKPAGLLSVRGRYGQDCLLDRFSEPLIPVHRLDQDTSGLIILARDIQTCKQLSQQFQQREICKIYEAVLSKKITQKQGVIDLPIWSDPNDRPKQKIDQQRGKPSITHFRVLEEQTRIEFQPTTGRTHQLRIHAAQGLGSAIVGDRLYGDPTSSDRLHLHARDLQFIHPADGKTIVLKTVTPF
ncbi:MAG: RluA family pseudouridine synthase [Phormidium tanganyikae FI6-MK23]|jgi:tRNA pseudouridine32 synthase/23S rRNA pseudouridine746 synthase|nr:RluA family pseudouridine synthase [Phormidium tanganyikae FI6-MK23]